MIRALVFACVLTAVAASDQDSRRPSTASISGLVVTTDTPPLAMRRAVVTLYGSGSPIGTSTISDDEGRFAFGGLAEGRYELSAARASFVTIAYGATRPNRPGALLVLAAGERRTDVRLLLARGAAITGTVRDLDGEPMPGLTVRVARTGSSSAAAIVQTDDQGVYRAYGLPAASYVVSAQPVVSDAGPLTIPSDAEVDAALRALRQRNPGAPAASSGGHATSAGADDRSDSVPVFHPGVFAAEDSTVVTVREGEERLGIDISVRMMRTATVSGAIAAPTGLSPSLVQIVLTKGTSLAAAVRRSAGPDGTFRFTGVTPGRYLLVATFVPAEAARAALGSKPPDAAASGQSCYFSAEELFIAGSDVSGRQLSLRPCPLLKGRIEVSRNSGNLSGLLAGVRISLEPDPTAGLPMLAPLRVPATSGADGQFLLGEAGDVLPGAYRLVVNLPDTEVTRSLTLETATLDGKDVLDSPVIIAAGAPPASSLVVHLSDRRASLSGVIETSGAAVASQYTLVVFPTNRDWWRSPYRRVRSVRPATNASYEFQDLPAGDYYLAALTDLTADDLRDTEFLSQLTSSAIRVTVGGGEKKQQNIRVGGS